MRFRFALLFLFFFHILYAQNKKNISLLSTVKFDSSGMSNIWGYTSPGGKEYALAGLTGVDNSGKSVCDCAVGIVDISDPTHPLTKFTVSGPNSVWREIKTWQQYAYITTEAGGGVTIVDLSHLPDSIKQKQFTGEGLSAGKIDAIHALHIDNGYLYLYGGRKDFYHGGIKIFSLADPWNPVFLGADSSAYVHDGIVQGDTAWAGRIYNGEVGIVDLKDRTKPQLISSFATPGSFTHNTWLSHDAHTLFTTDEVPASYVTSFDVRDPKNVIELDRYQHQPNDSAVVHNTYVLNDSNVTGFKNDFLWTSYYTTGVTLVDITYPENMVETGFYDCSDYFGQGYYGAWGVYPFFKSGNVIVSDMQGTMYILKPSYRRASYLVGNIKDRDTKAPLANVTCKILSNPSIVKFSKSNGDYHLGYVDTGKFDVQFSKAGFDDFILTQVAFKAGVIDTVNIEMSPVQIGINTQQISDEEMSIFPNPSPGSLNVKLFHPETIRRNTYLSVYDVLGKKQYSKLLDPSSAEVKIEQGFPSGIYYIKIENPEKVNTGLGMKWSVMNKER